MIPNIFHFINIGPRDLTLLHYLAIKSAYELNKPDIIYLYHDHDLKDTDYSKHLKNFVTFQRIDVLEKFRNCIITHQQYKADIIRLIALIKHGGIYFDIDLLSLKPITHLLNNKLVMGRDRFNLPLAKLESISNGIIMAEPNDPFLKEWLEEIPKHLDRTWAYHAVNLPVTILRKLNYPVTLLSTRDFLPFCWRDKWVLDATKTHLLPKLKDSYTIHLWATIWASDLEKIDEIYFLTEHNALTILFSHYLLQVL